MLLDRDERRLAQSLRFEETGASLTRPSFSVSSEEHGETRKRPEKGREEKSVEAVEEGEKSIEEQLAEARSLAESYCFTFNCTYTCGEDLEETDSRIR